jgi:hypothetical protein
MLDWSFSNHKKPTYTPIKKSYQIYGHHIYINKGQAKVVSIISKDIADIDMIIQSHYIPM